MTSPPTPPDQPPGGWSGDGIDPWLPERIAAQTQITAAERRMFAVWWGSLSDWMVGVRRGVFGNTALPPQAQAVFAQAPEWARLMGRFVNGPVRDTVGLAYDTLFGDTYLFDARPAVTSYLSEVHNRMVRTPEQVFDIVAKEVADGAASGESIPDIAKRVQTVLDTTENEDWHRRAVVVARTETIGALNAGRADAFAAAAEMGGLDLNQMWLATLDKRTRTAHLRADKQQVPVGQPFIVDAEPLRFPGDPDGSASNIIQCRCTTIPILSGDEVDLSDRGWPKSVGDWTDAGAGAG